MENRVRYLLFFVFCMFLYPLVTEAECSYERISELSKMASNVQLSYTYELKQTIEYDVHITNLTNDLYAMDSEGISIYGNNDVLINYAFGELSGVGLGGSIRYDIYSNDLNCKDEYLLTKYITLPDYNHFALSDECEKYPGFKYCSLWDNSNISYQEFYSELNDYKASLVKNNFDNSDDSNGSKLIFKNYYVVIGVVILIIIISLFLFKRRQKV